MTDNLPRLSSIPSRLLEDSSGLKATPRRGLAEVRNTPSQGQSDKKTARTFGGTTLTPTCLSGAFSAKKKSSVTLTIYEDPASFIPLSEMLEKNSIAESDEEMDTNDRDPKQDEESIMDLVMDGVETREKIEIEEEYERPVAVFDDDAKTIMFGDDDDRLSLYSISSGSEDEEGEWEEVDDPYGVSKYFYSPYGVATNFDEIYANLDVTAHDSDTEIENDVRGCSIAL